ncbi:MAG: FtsQ-type POTRA domain-containing protein [Candidatus Acidiferrales bacterium]|jgi:cell division protein FtsQ
MDADAYPQEVLVDEEPKYLRRQKPLEIKRRKFGRKAWKMYLGVTMWVAVGLAGAWVAYDLGHFLLASPEMALVHPDQVSLSGNHYVTRTSVLEIFAADRSRSVLRIPIEKRRRELEAIPWVEQATVRRALPNRIEVEITERTPIAFLRDGSDMALVDVHGVILERPLTASFHFPVVTGIRADMPQEDREQRMQLFSGFMQQIESARAGATEQVSEVDLSDGQDVRATLSGLQRASAGESSDAASPGEWGQADAPVVVHFGDGDFAAKYQTLVENIGQWRATAGRVESVDLRFSREAVVNPDTAVVAQKVAQQRPPKPGAARADRQSR